MARGRLISAFAGFGLACLILLIATGAPSTVSNRVVVAANAALTDAGHEWANAQAKGLAVEISGTAPNANAAQGALDDLRAALKAKGGSRVSFIGDIDADSAEDAPIEPYDGDWRIVFDGDMARLTGVGPGGLERQILLETLRDGLGETHFEDQTSESETPISQKWFDAAMRTARSLPLFEEGVIDYKAGVFSVSGVARDRGALEAAKDLLAAPSAPYSIAISLNVREPAAEDEPPVEDAEPDAEIVPSAPQIDPLALAQERADICNKALQRGLADFHIRFDSNSSEIDRGVARLLTDIAGIMRRCGRVRIEIAGHTDATGNETRNVALSQARARSVRAFLLNQGVGSASLSARGYGSARPLANNATERGRAQNRRIELIATPFPSIAADNNNEETTP